MIEIGRALWPVRSTVRSQLMLDATVEVEAIAYKSVG